MRPKIIKQARFGQKWLVSSVFKFVFMVALCMPLAQIDASSAQPYTGPRLTQDILDRYANSMKPVRDLMEAHMEKERKETPEWAKDKKELQAYYRSSAFFDSVQGFAQDRQIQLELDYIVRQHGFKNLYEWSEYGEKINYTWLAVIGGFDNAMTRKTLQKAEKTISKDSALPMNYQIHMLNIVDSAQKETERIAAISEPDKKLVKKNLKLLRAIFR